MDLLQKKKMLQLAEQVRSLETAQMLASAELVDGGCAVGQTDEAEVEAENRDHNPGGDVAADSVLT